MLSRIATAFVCFVLAVAIVNDSRADFVLNVSDGLNFAPNIINVDQGDTVTINFLLTQTNGETRLDLPISGLVNADFDATVAGSDITMSNFAINSSFADVNDAANPSGILGSEVRFNLEDTVLTGLLGATTANDTSGLDASGNSVVLGSTTFNIGASAVGNHVVTLVANEDGSGDRFRAATLTGSTGLTISDPTTFTFVVSAVAVPEPSSFAVLAITGCVLVVRRRRRA